MGQQAITGRRSVGSSVDVARTRQELFDQIRVEQVDASRLVIVHLRDWGFGRRHVTDLVCADDPGFFLWEWAGAPRYARAML